MIDANCLSLFISFLIRPQCRHNGDSKGDGDGGKAKKPKPPMLRARTLPAIIPPAFNIVQAQMLNRTVNNNGKSCQYGFFFFLFLYIYIIYIIYIIYFIFNFSFFVIESMICCSIIIIFTDTHPLFPSLSISIDFLLALLFFLFLFFRMLMLIIISCLLFLLSHLIICFIVSSYETLFENEKIFKRF